MLASLIAPLLFIYGTVIGSFLNVVILRSIAGRGLGGRSCCPNCRQQLRWWELVPIVSFMLVQGRCRACHRALSVQYPLVELAMGVLVVLLGFPLPQAGAAWLILILEISIAALLIVLFVIDLKTMLLPDFFVVLLGVSVAARLVVEFYYLLSTIYFIHSLYGIVVGSGCLGFLWLITRGRGIGLGDVKLMVPIGALFGGVDTAVLLFVSFFIGGLVAGYLLLAKRADMKTAIPFGPFLAGTAILLLVAPNITAYIRQLVFGGYL